MAVKTYPTQSAWDSDKASITESTIGLLNDTNETVAKGVDVVTEEPYEGDMVFVDENNNVNFIKLDTLQHIPSGWTPVGVVAERVGDSVYIVWKNNTSKKFADVYRYKVTGFNLDGNAHACTLTIHAVGGISYTYQGTTLAEVAAQLDSALQVSSLSSWSYSAYVDVDNIDGVTPVVYCQLNSYSAYQDNHSCTSGGLTFTPAVATENQAATTLYRANGYSSSYGGLNYGRFYDYYSVNGTGSASSMVHVGSDSIYNKNFFENNEYGAELRAAYGTYEAYIESLMVMWPSLYGVMAPYFRDGKTQTYNLAYKTYAISGNTGNTAYMYPAAKYCADAGIVGCPGLEPGDWWLPSPYESCYVWPKLTYGLTTTDRSAADPINRSLYAIGGSAISQASYAWFISRYNTDIVWYYSELGIFVCWLGFSFDFVSVPFVLYKLPHGNSNS